MEIPPPRYSGLTFPAVAAVALSVLALALVAALTSAGSVAVASVAVVFALGLGVALLRPGPTARLVIVLALQVFQLVNDEGLSLGEVVGGLGLLAYLGHWYGAALLNRRVLVTSWFDVAALTWGVGGLVGGAVLGQLFGADPYDFRADLLATLPFLLYLPVKDACARSPRASQLVAGIVIGFGVYSTAVNGLALRSALAGAEWYAIADARFITGEAPILAGLLLALSGVTVARGRRDQVVLILLSGLLMGGLILTKSRGYWIAAVCGLVVIAAMASKPARRRLLAYGALGGVLFGGFAVVFFGERVALLALGAIDRLISIQTAGTSISMLNRFAESAAAWEKIRVNPVLGYGWGVQVTHYSIIGSGTRHWAFLHNGYLALWLKTGLWGLGLMATAWIGGIARGISASRTPRLAAASRGTGLAAAGALSGFALVAITSNPFSLLDQMLIVTLMLALAHGAGARGQAVGAKGSVRLRS